LNNFYSCEVKSISKLACLRVQAYKKEGPKFMKHLVAKQKARIKNL